MTLSRRGFLAGTSAALAVRVVPALPALRSRRVLTLVYDKALGGMRAVEKVIRY